jgi:ankyrin repeat protein
MPRFSEYFGISTHVNDSLFMCAIKSGDYDKVEKDLKTKKEGSDARYAKSNKTYRDEKDGVSHLTTPLLKAVDSGDEAITELLIENGANIDTKAGYHGGNALHLSSKKGDKKLTKLLMKKGANHNSYDQDGYSPLIVAIHNGNVEIARLLLDLGADADLGCKNDKSALEHAVSLDKSQHDAAERIVEALFDNSVVATVRELHAACSLGSPSLVKMILSQDGVKVNQPIDGDSALHVAIAAGNEATTNYLLKETDVDTSFMNKDGMTALQLAEFIGTTDNIRDSLQAATDQAV